MIWLIGTILSLFGMYVAMWFYLLVHETGHRIMRSLYRIPTAGVELGLGPCAIRVRSWTFRAWPVAGHNEPLSYCLPITRWKKTMALLGGAGFNVLVGLALWMMAPSKLSQGVSIVLAFAAVQALGLIQLLPSRGRQGIPSDGLFLVALWCGMRFCPPHPCEEDAPDDYSSVTVPGLTLRTHGGI